MKAKFNLILIILLTVLFINNSCTFHKELEEKRRTIKVKSKYSKRDIKPDSTYQRSHRFEDCNETIGFSKNTSDRVWVHGGRTFRTVKINIKSFSQITESFLRDIDFDKKYEQKDRHGKRIKSLNVKKGDFFVAKSSTRVENYYVIKFINQIDEKVKIEYKLYKIKSPQFSKLNNIDKINYCLRTMDKKVLTRLIKEDSLDINICADFGNTTTTPLNICIGKNNIEMFDYLIENNVDINKVCRGNRTALMKAAYSKNHYFFKKLIKLGADTTIKDRNGKTVESYIKNKGNYELLKYLEK